MPVAFKKFSASLVLPLLVACGAPARAAPAKTVPVEGVLATVNRVPITEAQLATSKKVEGHDAKPIPPAVLLETAVREDLAAQSALKLGLDVDPPIRRRSA